MWLQRPGRSGLTSAVFGAGAVRLGLPSAVRGIPAVLRCNHCAGAATGIAHTSRIRAPLDRSKRLLLCFVVTGISSLIYFPSTSGADPPVKRSCPFEIGREHV